MKARYLIEDWTDKVSGEVPYLYTLDRRGVFILLQQAYKSCRKGKQTNIKIYEIGDQLVNLSDQ